MECAFTLLISFLAFGYVKASNTCSIADGSRVIQYSKRKVRIRAPCKFNFLEQQCGKYKVTVTPGLMYVQPFYVIDTVWIGVKEVQAPSMVWHGKTSNKVIAKSIIFGLKDRPPLKEASGSTLSASSLFRYTNSTRDVTIKARNGDFELTMGPWDFNGGRHKDSTLVFTCKARNRPVRSPRQFCGDVRGDGVKERSEFLWSEEDGEHQDLSLLFDLFNDTSIQQVDSECSAATTAFTSTCSSDAQRRESLLQCHQILTDDKRTQCVVKRACSPIRIFRACLQYVCNGYDYDEACEELGQGLDLCRKIGHNVTEEMKKPKPNGKPGCYRDLLTLEDNPYYAAMTMDD